MRLTVVTKNGPVVVQVPDGYRPKVIRYEGDIYVWEELCIGSGEYRRAEIVHLVPQT